MIYYSEKTPTGYSWPRLIPVPLLIDGPPAQTITGPKVKHLALMGWFPADPLPKLAEGQKYGEPQLVDGVVMVEAVPVAAEEMRVIYEQIIQEFMDVKALKLGYDSIASAVTYADEPAVPKFQVEGQAFRKWRSEVWAFGYTLVATVQSGNGPTPTRDELLAQLPELVLP